MQIPNLRARKNTKRAKTSTASLQWELDTAITVVLFAGLGGACQGLEEAGCPVHVANNHDDVALAAHAALHPHTKHIRGDIFDVDPVKATGGNPVKILWGSPDCRDHSRAKGGAPRSPRVRSLPWQMCRWAGKTAPQVIFIENVTEIRGWGPLIAQRCKETGRVVKLDGTVAARGEQVPIRQQALVRDKGNVGRAYKAFVAHLKGLGYAYDDRDLICADYGIPTSRKRFFAVARRDGHAIHWPARTHAPRSQAEALDLQPWVAASTIIDWTLPLPSIFERKKPLAEATLRRVAVGMQRFVLNTPRPFLVNVTHTKCRTGYAYDGDNPIPTFTTAKGGEFMVANPYVFPLTHQGDSRVKLAEEPLVTVTSAHRGELAVAAATITKFRKDSAGASVDEPLPTVTANGHSATRPGCAIPIGVTAAYLTEHRGCSTAQDVDTSIGCQTSIVHHAVTGAYAVQIGYGEREGQAARVVDLEAPIGTQVAGASKHGLVAAFMAQHNLGVVGHPVDVPVSTLTTAGSQQNVAGAVLVKYYKSEDSSQSPDEPVHTLTTKARIGLATAETERLSANYLLKLRGTSTAADATDPTPTLSAGGNHIAAVAALLEQYGKRGDQPIGSAVTLQVAGVLHAVVDIGMRMLEPHEAAAAHELTLPKEIEIDGKMRPLTKTEQMRLIGNSVPKRMARLLAQANAVHTLYQTKMAAD